MNFPDAMSHLPSLSELCLTLAFAGCIFTLIEAFLVLRFSDGRDADGPQPPVTLLKPLHGGEPDLPARLERFCRQDYGGPVQLVLGADDAVAPAVAAARAIKTEFPDRVIDIVVDARRHGSNRKVSNLVNMLGCAQHDTIVLSDSDIVVEPDYLRRLSALLATPGAGAVTCLYYGVGESFWERLSALSINVHFLPQAIAAARLGYDQHCCGATIALRRSTLDRIGGFRAFADMLADDYGIGTAVRALGYDLVTAPFLVGHRCFEAGLRELFLHQLRAARTIRSIEPFGYAGTIITHPFALALIGMLSGGTAAALIAAAAFTSRLTLCRCVEWQFGLPRQSLWLVPVHDLIAFAVYVMSFFGKKVHWQGTDYRVGASGALIEHKT